MPGWDSYEDLLKTFGETAFSMGGNAFFDVGALGAEAVSSPALFLQGFGNKEAAKEFARRKQERRERLPELGVTPRTDQLQDLFTEPAKEAAKSAWDWYAEQAPEGSEAVKQYFSDPRVAHTLESTILAAPSFARGARAFRNADFEANRGGKVSGMPGTQRGMVSWHGSPHEWDRVDLSKVGTGEGPAAFGWGFYSTDKEDLAQQYAKKLARRHQDNAVEFMDSLNIPQGQYYRPRDRAWDDLYTQDPEAAKDLLQRTLLYDQAMNNPWTLRYGKEGLRNELQTQVKELDHRIDKNQRDLERFKRLRKDYLELNQRGGKGDVDPEMQEVMLNVYRREGVANDEYYRQTLDDFAREDTLLKRQRDAIDTMDWDKVPEIKTGKRENVYKLDIDDDAAENFMDWFQPLGAQGDMAERIMKHFDKSTLQRMMYGDELDGPSWADSVEQEMLYDLQNMKGSEFYRNMEQAVGRGEIDLDVAEYAYEALRPDKAVSLGLRDAGIPGIKYLAGGHRRKDADPKYNWVTFEEKNIKTLERNGEPVDSFMGPKGQRGAVNFFGSNTKRDFKPGIYESVPVLAAQAESQVVPESPALRQLFNTSRAELADIASRQGNTPGRFFQNPNAKGSAAAKMIMTPENEDRLISALLGMEKYAPRLTEGMTGWYVLDPLKDKFIDVLGERGLKEFSDWNALTAMNSPGAPVDWEIPRGSAAFMASRQGNMDDWMRWGGSEEFRPGHLGWNFPGHPYHSTAHGGPIQKYLQHGDIMSKEPKVPLYRQASEAPELGFQTDTPVPDAHWSRAVGLGDVRGGNSRTGWGKSASGPEMVDLAPWWRDKIAKEVGIESVPAQARAWGLFAPQTGVETAIGAPKLELIADAVMMTAKRLNISPEQALEMIIRGEAYAGK